MTKLTSVTINDEIVLVTTDISVAAAIALSGNLMTRTSVSGQVRAPVCGMGICMECRVTIDGQAHQLACQTLCIDGMQIKTGHRA